MTGSKLNPAMSDQSRAAIEATADALYGGSLRDFANDRKRLATELRQAGSRAAATVVGKLPRPTLSAWLVNRLWRQARPEFDALFDAAARIRRGELAAVPEQRAVLARLRSLAAEVLRADGHAAAEGTLSRTGTTLQALAATGSFDPDPPGRLLADRDPPGFESMAAMLGHTPGQAADALIDDTAAPADSIAARDDSKPTRLQRDGGSASDEADTEEARGKTAAGKRDAAKRDVAERDVAERDVAKRDAAERDVVKRDAAERGAAKRDAAERDVAERATAQRAAAERATAERAAAERAAAERAAAERAAAERARAQQRERATAELTNLVRIAEQARRNEEARSKAAEDLRVALQRAETALADARARAEASTRHVAEARARLDELTRDLDPSP